MEFPPRNTNAVAIAGNSAHGPGNFVVSVNSAMQQHTITKPTQARTPSIICDVRLFVTGKTANKAPIDNSNARVCGAKNAHGCEEFISTMHMVKEATETTVANAPILRRTENRELTPTPTQMIAIIAGHNR